MLGLTLGEKGKEPISEPFRFGIQERIEEEDGAGDCRGVWPADNRGFLPRTQVQIGGDR